MFKYSKVLVFQTLFHQEISKYQFDKTTYFYHFIVREKGGWRDAYSKEDTPCRFSG